nr:GNAT family N-acetyltransferase [Tatlockia sp.]
LLRYCFEAVGEARTWLLEADINDKESLALYRQNGFQTLAQQTYWEIPPSLLQELALREPDLPNLLPVSNADAQLLYQLDTASMPPLVRQVFDRNADDFKTSLLGGIVQACQQWLNKLEVVSGYVFEPQRKAAIGYFQIRMCRQGTQPHVATLTVHPAYTWLYPELLSQLARIAQDLPPQSLQLASADYQQEREDYLEQIGAKRVEHTLMMSRSVYHKLRESKFASLEGLQWSEMLQGFQPARKPVAGGMSWIGQPKQQLSPIELTSDAPNLTSESSSYSTIESLPPSELGNQ